MEQMVRDVRISQIYEGTNAIQAMDLVGRKLGLDGGRLFNGWLNEVEATLKRTEGRNGMAEFTGPLKDSVERLKGLHPMAVRRRQERSQCPGCGGL